jgi:PRC-barrel domain
MMSYTDARHDTYGIYRKTGKGPGPYLMGADTLIGEDVYNAQQEKLGDIKEIMLEMDSGRVRYAVLSFGGFLGLGEKLFAVPWNALRLDTANKRFVLNIEKARLKNAPGFDKDDWPDMTNDTWASGIHSFYGTERDASDSRIH